MWNYVEYLFLLDVSAVSVQESKEPTLTVYAKEVYEENHIGVTFHWVSPNFVYSRAIPIPG